MSVRAKHIMILAGEPSGDVLGARLMAALDARTNGAVRIEGIGGEAMTARGLSSLIPMEELSVMGLFEILPRVPRLLRRIRQTAVAVARARPDALVTIDSPGFNFRVAARLAGRDFPLIHYVAPQVWAWRPGRARAIARHVDHMLLLLPFEAPYFDAVALPTTFVGHPVTETKVGAGAGAAYRARHGFAPESTLLAVLPGSRHSETSRLLSVFGETVARLAARIPGLNVVVPTVAGVAEQVQFAAQCWPCPVTIVRGQDEKAEAFAACDAALTASGTAVLELAVAQVPMVVGYRVNPLTMALARRLVTVERVSLFNLVLDRPVVPELLQDQCRPDALAKAVERIIVDGDARSAQIAAAREVSDRLSVGGARPSERAADAILELTRKGAGR